MRCTKLWQFRQYENYVKIRNAYNNFQNMFLLEYRGWVGIKYCNGTGSRHTILNNEYAWNLNFANRENVKSEALAIGLLMKSQNEALNFIMNY